MATAVSIFPCFRSHRQGARTAPVSRRTRCFCRHRRPLRRGRPQLFAPVALLPGRRARRTVRSRFAWRSGSSRPPSAFPRRRSPYSPTTNPRLTRWYGRPTGAKCGPSTAGRQSDFLTAREQQPKLLNPKAALTIPVTWAAAEPRYRSPGSYRRSGRYPDERQTPTGLSVSVTGLRPSRRAIYRIDYRTRNDNGGQKLGDT